MCHTTTNHKVQTTWASLHSLLYCWRWLQWILLWYMWRRAQSKALVLLLFKLWVSCTSQMYSWEQSKYQVTHILVTCSEVFAHLSITHTPLLSLRKSKITLNVIDVIVLEKSWSINVANVISTCTIIVYRKDKCCFCFYSILDLVHKIVGAWNSSNKNAVILFNPLSWHHG